MSIHQSVVTAAALIFASAVGSFSAAGGAETRIVGVVGSEDQTVGRLTLQVAALELRIKKLEAGLIDVQRSLRKADTPDDDGGSDKRGKKGADGGNPTGAGGQGAKDSSPTGGSKSGSSSSDGDAGAANFALTTVYSGGKMVVQTDSGAYSMSVGALDKAAGMKFRADNKTRTYVGLDTRGKGLLAVYTGDSEQPVAGVQSTDEDKGLVAVFNSGKPVAFLSQSGAHPGGGNLTTTDPGGNGVFSAGYDGEGGAACVNHKQSMHCLGIGLPLGGGQ